MEILRPKIASNKVDKLLYPRGVQATWTARLVEQPPSAQAARGQSTTLDSDPTQATACSHIGPTLVVGMGVTVPVRYLQQRKEPLLDIYHYSFHYHYSLPLLIPKISSE